MSEQIQTTAARAPAWKHRWMCALLAVFTAMLQGCRERVYLLHGELTTDAPDCRQYAHLEEIEPALAELRSIFYWSTRTLDPKRLARYAQEVREQKTRLDRLLTPEQTDLKYTAHFEWKIRHQYLSAGAQVIPRVLSRNGFEVPLGSLRQSDQEGARVISFEGPASLLEVCGMSQSVQGLLEVRAGGETKFYYRLGI